MSEHTNAEMEWVYKEKRYCFISWCNNNKVDHPNKVFVIIPKLLQKEWCDIVGRKCPKTRLYCCEDHLNLKADLDNYNTWTKGSRPQLKTSATLRNVKCNQDVHGMRKKILCSKENLPSTASSSKTTLHSVQKEEVECVSVAVQCKVTTVEQSVSCMPSMKSQGTNFKGRKLTRKVFPSILPESGESTPCRSSPSLFGSSNFEDISSSSEEISAPRVPTNNNRQSYMMNLVEKKPKTCLGLPKNNFWLVEYIRNLHIKQTSILSIIMTLFKIKQGDTVERMSDQWEVSRVTFRNQFHKNIELLASFFQNFLFLPTPLQIKLNLPLVFKMRFSHVQCIIDAFEIEIEKPSDPVRQAQTWSNYKACNTIKYLLSCTPNGFINFVSKGYGGRISDKALTEKSGFIDTLPPNCTILADRGFKELEPLSATKNIKLLRPPSVSSLVKPSKKDVIQGKVIASLRVHIERVIRRVREFKSLKPHSVVNNKHVKYLDEMVIIACGLINLQDPIIKEY